MNKHTGEVELILGDKPYTLQFDLRALAAVSSKYGDDYLEKMSKMISRADVVVTLTAIGLKKHHKEITEEFIYDLSPSLSYLAETVQTAFLYGFNGVNEPPAKSENQDPPDDKKKTA